MPTIIPSKDHIHYQNLLQIKDSINFLGDNPKSTPKSDLGRDPFMFSTANPIMVPSHLPSTVTIFEKIHTLRSFPVIFPYYVLPDLPSLLPVYVPVDLTSIRPDLDPSNKPSNL